MARTSKGALQALAGRWRAAFEPLVGVVKARENVSLHGKTFLEQRVGNVRFHVGASSFFQVNYRQTARMVDRVRTLLDPQQNTRLLDLYCGVGLFALSLAPFVAEVVGIEEWAPAIEDARRSAKLNGASNTAFEVGAVERVLQAQNGSFDRVVLDPPRRGCAPEVLDALTMLAPQRIVYVSCHPGTLARDCKQLAAAGYRITSAEVIDMFPHTHHVESIVRLERAG
jgi:23S rRNA (uracil1939-C5)-methyltransferase